MDASRYFQVVMMFALLGGLVWSLGFHRKWQRYHREDRDLDIWLRRHDEQQNRRRKV